MVGSGSSGGGGGGAVSTGSTAGLAPPGQVTYLTSAVTGSGTTNLTIAQVQQVRCFMCTISIRLNPVRLII